MKILLTKEQVVDVAMRNRTALTKKPVFSKDTILAATSREFGIFIDESKTKEVELEPATLPAGTYNGAIIIVRGPFAIDPIYKTFDEMGNALTTTLFVFHWDEMNAQNRELAKEIAATEKEKLFHQCDEEYLYEVFADTSDTLLHETITQYAKALPIFEISFNAGGTFRITDLGTVQPLDYATKN